MAACKASAAAGQVRSGAPPAVGLAQREIMLPREAEARSQGAIAAGPVRPSGAQLDQMIRRAKRARQRSIRPADPKRRRYARHSAARRSAAQRPVDRGCAGYRRAFERPRTSSHCSINSFQSAATAVSAGHPRGRAPTGGEKSLHGSARSAPNRRPSAERTRIKSPIMRRSSGSSRPRPRSPKRRP